MKKRNLANALIETIAEKDLQEFILTSIEAVSDSFLEDNWFKDLPIFSLFYQVGNITSSIQDKLFTRKVLSFLFSLEGVSTEKRLKTIEKINTSSEYSQKMGEKLLFILDNCEDDDKSKIIGHLFSSFLEGKMDDRDFFRSSKAINMLFLDDLKRFLNNKHEVYDFVDDGQLIAAGVLYAEFIPSALDHENRSNSGIYCGVSPLGQKIKQALMHRQN